LMLTMMFISLTSCQTFTSPKPNAPQARVKTLKEGEVAPFNGVLVDKETMKMLLIKSTRECK
jgi:hypothetical protein